jgi:hypothetical protein
LRWIGQIFRMPGRHLFAQPYFYRYVVLLPGMLATARYAHSHPGLGSPLLAKNSGLNSLLW